MRTTLSEIAVAPDLILTMRLFAGRDFTKAQRTRQMLLPVTFNSRCDITLQESI
jgi:hypothetical protein